jgi:hypothetical protein
MHGYSIPSETGLSSHLLVKVQRASPNPYDPPPGISKPLEVVMALNEAGEATFPLIRPRATRPGDEKRVPEHAGHRPERFTVRCAGETQLSLHRAL